MVRFALPLVQEMCDENDPNALRVKAVACEAFQAGYNIGYNRGYKEGRNGKKAQE